MIEVIPIFLTQVDWNPFLRETTRILGQSPALYNDAAGIKTDKQPIKALLGVLKTITCGHETPSLQRHINIGFLVTGLNKHQRQDLALSTMAGLAMTFGGDEGEQFVILTATLDIWVSFLYVLKDERLSSESRFVYDKIFLLFEQLGLRDLWNLRKQVLPDKTFKLVDND